MTGAALLAIFETIGSVVGIIITLITFFTLISKRPRAAFRKVIKEEAEAANAPLKEKLNDIEKRLNDNDQTDVVTLRHSITDIYERYKHEKKIPRYAKEDWLSLYKQYDAKKGNSYVHSITEEMEKWEEI